MRIIDRNYVMDNETDNNNNCIHNVCQHFEYCNKMVCEYGLKESCDGV